MRGARKVKFIAVIIKNSKYNSKNRFAIIKYFTADRKSLTED